MGGSLVKIDEVTISSDVTNVILGGGSSGSSGLNVSIDSTYDVYVLKFNNLKCDTDGAVVNFRVTKSGSADTTSNYDTTHRNLYDQTYTIGNSFNASESYMNFGNCGTGTS